jgi:hypothetical protein
MAAKRRGVYERTQSKPMRRNGHEQPFKGHTSSQVGNRIVRENRSFQGHKCYFEDERRIVRKSDKWLIPGPMLSSSCGREI